MAGTRVNLDWMAYKRGDYIILYASKLAACAGMHRYVPRDGLKSEFLRAVGLNDGFETPAEVGEAQVSAMVPADREVVEQTAAASYASASEVSAAFQELQERVAMQPEAAEGVRSRMYTKHGLEQESNVRAAAEERTRKKIKTCAEFRTCEYPLMTVRGVEVYVGGRHDGMTQDGELVEIKTRQNRFLGTPLYELIQVHAYMHIYGTRTATIIESFNGEQRAHAIVFDEDVWGRAVSATTMFVEDILDASDGGQGV
jgi:hypothetical protein